MHLPQLKIYAARIIHMIITNKFFECFFGSLAFAIVRRYNEICVLVIASILLSGCAGEKKQTVEASTGLAKKSDISEIHGLEELKSADPVIVYSSRNEQLIKPVFELFTTETGIEIEYATDKAGVLIERLKMEGKNTPADVLITVDAGNLGFAASQDLFQHLNSTVIDQRVPSYLRDDNDFWTGLSLRARTIVYSTDRVSSDQLSTYESLGDDKWKGRLCLRTSKKVYNQSLVAMLIAQHGESQTQAIVERWVYNLAAPPMSNDTKVMEAILAGQCDVGVVNTYYFGRLQRKTPNFPLALFWPNQSGVHVNVAGAGILKYSPQPVRAKKLVEWLTSDNAQKQFAGINQEYPVSTSVEIDEQVASWGEFTNSLQPLSQAYLLQPLAVKLMDRAGYK